MTDPIARTPRPSTQYGADPSQRYPTPTPESAPFWSALEQGEFVLPWCDACASFFFYPRGFCPRCGASDVRMLPASGRASLLSYIVNTRSVQATEPGPEVIAIVRTEEGPTMLTRLVGLPAEVRDIAIGSPLEVRLVEVAGSTLPLFAVKVDA